MNWYYIFSHFLADRRRRCDGGCLKSRERLLRVDIELESDVRGVRARILKIFHFKIIELVFKRVSVLELLLFKVEYKSRVAILLYRQFTYTEVPWITAHSNLFHF